MKTMARAIATLRKWAANRLHDRYCPCPFPDYDPDADTVASKLVILSEGSGCPGCGNCGECVNAGPAR